MLIWIELKSAHKLPAADLETLRATVSSGDVEFVIHKPVRHGLSAIDPTVIDLTMKLASGTAVAAAVTGAFKCLAEWIRGRAQIAKIRVGDVEISVPASEFDRDFRVAVEEILKVAASDIDDKPVPAATPHELQSGSGTSDGDC